MTPAKIFYRIRSEKNYLLQTYLFDMFCMGLMLSFFAVINWQVSIEATFVKTIVITTLAIINGLIVSSILHNTSHANVPTKLLNRIVGEYCGYYVLYGFTNFSLVHILHHQHSDDELDPVNPKGMNFFVFLTAPMRYMIKTTKVYLNSVHGEKENYAKIMKIQTAIFHLNLVLRAALWFVLLGKFLFVVFYLPTFLTIVCIFAHINYNCHQERENGSIEIVNLNHNVYYKVANFFTMGGYYHKNHHLNMKLFNPKSLVIKRVVPKMELRLIPLKIA
jgi:fatty acid desaturase